MLAIELCCQDLGEFVKRRVCADNELVAKQGALMLRAQQVPERTTANQVSVVKSRRQTKRSCGTAAQMQDQCLLLVGKDDSGTRLKG